MSWSYLQKKKMEFRVFKSLSLISSITKNINKGKKVSNEDLYHMARSTRITLEMLRPRLKWVG